MTAAIEAPLSNVAQRVYPEMSRFGKPWGRKGSVCRSLSAPAKDRAQRPAKRLRQPRGSANHCMGLAVKV